MSKRKSKTKVQTHLDEGRRKFLWDIGVAAVGAVLSRPMDSATKVVAGLVDDLATAGDRAALTTIGDIERGLQVFAGNTNKLAAAAGRPGLSVYLRNSAKAFGAFVVKAAGDDKRFENVSEEDATLALNLPNNDLILLGGPVANNLGARFTGHDFVTVREMAQDVLLPVFDHAAGLRWGFFCGRTGYGDWGNQLLKARRYENGQIVERPLYGLWDLIDSSKNPRPFSLDNDNYLRGEALLITRVANPYSAGRTITTIGGVHGYSASAFFLQSELNLKALNILSRGAKTYQVMVPVRLMHDHKICQTTGTLEWTAATISHLGT